MTMVNKISKKNNDDNLNQDSPSNNEDLSRSSISSGQEVSGGSGKTFPNGTSLIEMVRGYMEVKADDLATIPAIAQKILSEFKNPECSLQDLETLVRQDQVIAGKVMLMANSSFYRGLNDTDNLSDAIMRLGFKELRNISLTVAMKKMYGDGQSRYTSLLENLWSRSVVCAAVSRELSEVIRYAGKDEAYLAGLVHDIGHVSIIEALEALSKNDTRIAHLEKDVFEELLDVLHEDGGADLVEKWSFPDPIVEAVRFHHRPDQAPGDNKLPWIIAASDLLARRLGLGTIEAEPGLSLTGSPVMQALHLSDMAIARLLVDLEDKSNEMLEIW